MIHFYRDILDGLLYFALSALSIMLIMALIGYILETINGKKEEEAVEDIQLPLYKPEPDMKLSNTLNLDSIASAEDVLSIHQLKSKDHSYKYEEKKVEVNEEPTLELEIPEQKQEEVITIDSSSLDVEVKEVETKEVGQEPAKVEEVKPVIDFGSTEDVNLNELK